MSPLSCLGQMALMSTLLLLTASALPRRGEDSGALQRETGVNAPGSCSHAPLGEQFSPSGEWRGEARRQLGDIEFSNRYAEYLRAKAKHSSLCAFLRRMQTVKKSGHSGEDERLSELLAQYRCPGDVWNADL